MESDKLIHVKIDYSEGVEAKKDILNAQMSLIKILQSIKKYHSLRANELKVKTKLKSTFTRTKTNLTKLNATIPKIKIPEILHKEDSEKHTQEKKIDIKEVVEKQRQQKVQDELSMELQDIQAKLKGLSA